MIDVLIFRCTSCQSARPQRDQFGNSMGLRFLFLFFFPICTWSYPTRETRFAHVSMSAPNVTNDSPRCISRIELATIPARFQKAFLLNISKEETMK